MFEGPLSGVRILDLSRVFAGPWATQVLADFGAEVIKVERPGRGDDARGLGPPFLADEEGRDTAESAFYLSANRNKKSIALDLSQPRGQEIVRQFAAISDVVVENYKVGTLKRYALDYDSLKEVNPSLVYCSITGFGQTGPNSHKPGYDTLFQAMGGVMSVTGEPDEKPGGGPMKVGIILADIMTGMYAAIGILAALRHRERTGTGQHIDLSLMDAQTAALSHHAMYYLVSGSNPQRFGTSAPAVVPSQMFECSDGFLVLVVGNDPQFRRFAEVVGQPKLADEERFSSNGLRVRNREILVPLLEEIFRRSPKAYWLDKLEAAGIASGPINEISDVFSAPQIAARDMVVEVEHSTGSPLKLVANPLRMSETPLTRYEPPPVLGQHTMELLSGVLGLGNSEIEALLSDKVVAGS
ncbi:CaiB/BaiF CoA transferase family protein [Neorhizobium tomejilense]|uniref:CaiB/BaiF CoA transferase family protein n=1 Tax=Neorhizobium tomejilense TaxID=2093828 RepID=UPI003ECF22DE